MTKPRNSTPRAIPVLVDAYYVSVVSALGLDERYSMTFKDQPTFENICKLETA
jgi:hypothetical protein